jgi:acetyltransferase-like isoleucine patch superfamily enzyme
MYLAELYYKLSGKEIPYYARFPLWLIIWKPIRKFINVVIIPNIPFSNLRIFLYRYLVGYKIGKKVFIGMKCYLDDLDPKHMTIEDNVVISYGCYFALHGINQEHTYILLKNGCYIGMRATIVAGKEGIVIGENSIVGAASLVNKNIPAESTAAGVPAKILNSIG